MRADKDAIIAELKREIESLNADFIANVRTTKVKPCADKERIAELEARNKRIEDCLVHERTRVADLVLTNEELERKLAEQQAALFTIRTIVAGCDSDEATRIIRHLQKHFDNQHTELGTLLAKAKEEGRKEALPEGWQVVPKDATLEMKQAYYENFGVEANYKAAYREMLAAAPKPQGETKCQ